MSAHSSRGPKWEALRKACLERDSHICTHCGGHATEADHVIPKSMGGRDDLSNLIASCKPCNASRGNKMLVRSAWWHPELLDGLR